MGNPRFGVVLLAISFAISACGGGQNAAVLPTLDGMVVFGDDISDGGQGANGTFALTEGQGPQTPPYYQGRWSNGPIYSDWLHGHLGIPQNQAKDNFAIAGATTGTLNLITGEGGGALSQIQKYLAASSVSPTALYIIFAGSNNFLVSDANVDTVIPEALDDIAEGVELLAESGAKHIVLVTIPSYGRAPFAQPLGLKPALDSLTVAFNDNLSLLVNALKGQYPEVNFFLVNAFEVQFGVLLMPEMFGLADVDNPCLAGTEVCSAPDLHLWWDEMHFSRPFHQILGGQFANALCAEPYAFTNCRNVDQGD